MSTAAYRDLENLPSRAIGELFDGRLHAQSRVAVPDLAGWRRERKLKFPTGHKIELVPDWVCEILSPSTRSIDREIKMPLYARYGVSYAWLVEPIEHVVDAYRLQDGEWVEIGCYAGTSHASIPPFDAVPLDLGSLWMPID